MKNLKVVQNNTENTRRKFDRILEILWLKPEAGRWRNEGNLLNLEIVLISYENCSHFDLF